MWNRNKTMNSASTQNEDWFTFNQKNKPQSNALAGGILLMLSSGLQLGWLFNTHILHNPFASGRSDVNLHSILTVFFIPASIGAVIASFLMIEKTSKKKIYLIVTTVSGISSILMISLPHEYYAIFFARLLAGWAFGVGYITVLTHGSEIVHQKQRGLVLTSVNLMIYIGVMTLGSLTMVPDNEKAMPTLRLIGILNGVFVALAFALLGLTEESPVKLMKEKNDAEALRIMIKVRSETHENFDIRTQFIELKTMVEEDALKNNGLIKDDNLIPLELIFLMKLANVLSFNYPLNMILLNSVNMSDDVYSLNEVLLSTARLIPILIALFTIDLARRPHFLVAAGGSAVMLILLGIVYAVVQTPSNILLLTLTIAFQLFCGMGLGFTGDVMASEAFNCYKKAKSIAFLTMFEFITQIVLIWVNFQLVTSDNTTRFSMLIVFGAIMLLIVMRLFFKLPETARMSIRQSRSEFTKR